MIIQVSKVLNTGVGLLLNKVLFIFDPTKS